MRVLEDLGEADSKALSTVLCQVFVDDPACRLETFKADISHPIEELKSAHDFLESPNISCVELKLLVGQISQNHQFRASRHHFEDLSGQRSAYVVNVDHGLQLFDMLLYLLEEIVVGRIQVDLRFEFFLELLHCGILSDDVDDGVAFILSQFVKLLLDLGSGCGGNHDLLVLFLDNLKHGDSGQGVDIGYSRRFQVDFVVKQDLYKNLD